MSRTMTLGEFLTPAEISQATAIWSKWRPLFAPRLSSCTDADLMAETILAGWHTMPKCANEIARVIIAPNKDRIDKALDQGVNDPAWLGYAIIYVLDQSMPASARES